MVDFDETLRQLSQAESDITREEAAAAFKKLMDVNGELIRSLDAQIEQCEIFRCRAEDAEERCSNLEMEIERLAGPQKIYAENDYLRNQISALDGESRVMRAQLDIVYLIFGHKG